MALFCGAQSIRTLPVAKNRDRWKFVFSPRELRASAGRVRVEERLAARVAAKRLAISLFEAAGFSGVTCLAIEIRNSAQGKPYFAFLDRNLKRFAAMNFGAILLTLSHTRQAGYAAVFAESKAG